MGMVSSHAAKDSKAARSKERAIASAAKAKAVRKAALKTVVAARPTYGQMAGLHGTPDALALKSSVAYVIDQDTHEVVVNDSVVELSPTEFKLLRYLMLNPNRVLSKAQILDHVWEYDFNGDAGIVESYVSYLRRKLDAVSTEPLIATKRGFGYMLKVAKAS